MKSIRCVICSGVLSGRQRRFCSLRCKNSDTNNRHQNYRRQQERGLDRKLAFLSAAGGKCSRCGYARNLAALGWHHLDPTKKVFSLDLRSMSNRNEAELRQEIGKCVLLCANCHAEVHLPELTRASSGTKKNGRISGR